MICPNCGEELQEDDVYCFRCGYKVEKPLEEQTPTVETFSPDEKRSGERCPNCGEKVEKGDAFCVRCGYRLQASAENTSSGNRGRAPKLNVPVGDAGFVEDGQPEMICSMCGCKIPASSAVCPICQQPTQGYDRRRQDPRVAYRVQERPRVRKKPFNVFALIGFIFAMLGLLVTIASGSGIALSIAGLVLGIIGLVKSKKTGTGKGFAIAAIVVSAVAIVLFAVALVLDALEIFTYSSTGSEPVFPDSGLDFWDNENLF